MNIIFDLSGVLFGTQTSKPCSIQNRFACALRPINPVNSLKLLHDCIQSGHRLFIVSNLTAEDFDFLKADPQALRVFNYFEDIVLAGKVGIQKPDPRIFNYLLEKHGLDPHSSVFIDDEAVNLYGAEQAGITKGILCSDHNFNSIRQELELHGAL
jgi:FMN phosphatase YigB (HAD superfamily)